MLKDVLSKEVVVMDGAMGTYFAQKMGSESTLSEYASISYPSVIKGIHEEYMNAGARLIRTNTFCANPVILEASSAKVRQLITASYRIAEEAAGAFPEKVWVAADIGPIPLLHKGQEISSSARLVYYYEILDVFLSLGASLFLFETFSEVDVLPSLIRYIREKNPHAEILAFFTLTLEGRTRSGMSFPRLIQAIGKLEGLTGYGFNCGVGPLHLKNVLGDFKPKGHFVGVLPNAGYPDIVNGRTTFYHNPDYFGEILNSFRGKGYSLLGGCCGTTPYHIKALAQGNTLGHIEEGPRVSLPARARVLPVKNTFKESLEKGAFPIAVELAPPKDHSVEGLLKVAGKLKDEGVSLITVSDSPLGRPRLDSVMLAAKIFREVGILTMPHLCCRDRNHIGLRAALLGAHMEGIRNILAVTGDPIASSDRTEIKSVFNYNSFALMEMITKMNQGEFEEDPFFLGGAVNVNVRQSESEYIRVNRKKQNGAKVFFTQPISSERAVSFLKKMPKTYVLGGILPIVSYKNACFLQNEIPGIVVSEDTITRFAEVSSREEGERLGLELALATIERIKDEVNGLYLIMPQGRIGMMLSLLKEIRSLL